MDVDLYAALVARHRNPHGNAYKVLGSFWTASDVSRVAFGNQRLAKWAEPSTWAALGVTSHCRVCCQQFPGERIPEGDQPSILILVRGLYLQHGKSPRFV